MESVRERHVSPPAEKQAKNRDKIAEDKGEEEGGRQKKESRGGRKAKIDGGADSAETTALMATGGPRSPWLHAFPAPQSHANLLGGR